MEVQPQIVVTVQQLTRTPLLLLQLLFIAGWYVVLAFADEDFSFMLLKALGIGVIVGSVHNLNAFLLWRQMQRTRAELQARVSGQLALTHAKPSAKTFLTKNAMSIMRFYLLPVTVAIYSMTVSKNPNDFRLLYPITKSSPEGLYHLEILFIILVAWAAGSKVFALLVVALVPKQLFEEVSIESPKLGPPKSGPPKNSLADTVRRHTGVGFQLLWSLLIYWLYVMINHLTESKAAKIPVSLVLCALVGMSLNVNGFVLWKTNKIALDNLRKQLGEKLSETNVVSYVTGNVWTGFRFFLVPFCVSTYSIVSSSNDEFVYLFPNGSVGPLPDMVLEGIIILTFLCLSQIFRVVYLKAAT